MPVFSRWSYEESDPYAITLAFRGDRGQWVKWSFGRDLVINGLIEPAGLGDVRVHPDLAESDLLMIELESPHGYAVVEMAREDAERFVTATLEAVPLGAEKVDVDAFIAEIIKV
ncbi:MAG TPA: SsgA family sporulation/cell division regulator [Amycolatopsis sp.]|nr:SsgA family sporulation/cell division regulator [Amycolatopsis sp.]HKS45894.1 SsgA family sporulation/cell division regulator [Amycolatopsis sp.]